MTDALRPPTIEDLLNVTNVGDPHLSPDGEVVAFVVADKYEKAPRAVPSGPGGASAPVAADHYATHRQRPASRIWQVSVGGGKQPLWSRDGRELFYRDFAGNLFSVPVTRNATFTPGRPQKILDNRSYLGSGRSLAARTYDVSPDGRRFLLLKAQSSDTTSFVIVVNWPEELKRRTPAR